MKKPPRPTPQPRQQVEHDPDKVDEAALALLYLTTFDDGHGGKAAWKGHDWDVLNRLHQKGYIANPVNKNKSVSLTTEGARRSLELFRERFGTKTEEDAPSPSEG